ncbi:vesicle-associated membrane protein 5 isoform X1 [Stegastes partitus]|uniref:Vesicle-associated membrane protein 3-like n=1 Tax=Stegastes partitus TaxID=144197 RepID=A0A3B5ACA9_9TELE|nr:PREDICTED: vesicle-associated membrane protein 5-like isoform X1 [Stegastes partitus]
MENGKSRLQQTQDDVEELKDIMLDNLNKADERNEKLGELENRAEDLLERGKAFEKNTKQLKTQTESGNRRMRMLFIAVGVVGALIIVGLIIFAVV